MSISILDVLTRPTLGDLYDQNFGLGLEELLPTRSLVMGPLRSGYIRPWRHIAPLSSGVSNLKIDKDGFKVAVHLCCKASQYMGKIRFKNLHLIITYSGEFRCATIQTR